MKKITNNGTEIKAHLDSGDIVIPAGGSIVLPDFEASLIMAKYTDSAPQPDQSVKHVSFLSASEYVAPKEEPVKLEEKPKVEKAKVEKKKHG